MRSFKITLCVKEINVNMTRSVMMWSVHSANDIGVNLAQRIGACPKPLRSESLCANPYSGREDKRCVLLHLARISASRQVSWEAEDGTLDTYSFL